MPSAAIGPRFGPRVVAVPDQIIDYTWGRISTICEEPGTPVLTRRLR
jgi:5'-methylthioinosine phosphorylase